MNPDFTGEKVGEPGGNRTLDPPIKSPLLFPVILASRMWSLRIRMD